MTKFISERMIQLALLSSRRHRRASPLRAGRLKYTIPALCLAAIAVAPSALRASGSDSNQTFTGFRVPEVDAQGNLKWNLRGTSGHLRSEELVDLQGVNVEFYQGKEVNMTLTTPTCLFNRTTKRAETDSPVQIETSQFRITADGMDWESDQNIMRLHRNVKIILPPRAKTEALSGKPVKPQ